jgi:hypothetical protein
MSGLGTIHISILVFIGILALMARFGGWGNGRPPRGPFS